MPNKTCFVVMGFGQKIDFQSNPQRTLDLDKTYRNIIKPAVEEAGLACIRADEVTHSGVIDKPMYERLLDADLVIADLSTANVNAVYELGVRHALRPHATIIMVESQFKFPFDLNHVTMLTYTHLGSGIDFDEVMKVKGQLKERIVAVIDKGETDSPVFLFLPHLLTTRMAVAPGSGSDETPPAGGPAAPPSSPPPPPPPPPAAPMAPATSGGSLADYLEAFRKAKAQVKKPADWLAVIGPLQALRAIQPEDAYFVQQLALATYKSEVPNRMAALRGAEKILEPLLPATSNDAETVGLWGAVHKRLWEEGHDQADLDRAIRAYQRGYFLKTDHYNGINFAYLLDVRAAATKATTPEEAAADRVLANRYRSEIIILCDDLLANPALAADERYWIMASRAEAAHALGRPDAAALVAAAIAAAPEDWMKSSLNQQLDKLKALGR